MIASLSFEEAIACTENLFTSADLSEPELQQAIADLIRTDNGARGFYVYYLTNPVGNHPTEAVIKAIQAVPEPSAELLVKNLVMSTAMAIAHRRNQDESHAQGSQQVKERTANLISLLNLTEVKRIANLMKAAAESGTGEYANFLTKWGYDSEQRQAIATITTIS
ncbi:hypothetical protein Syn7502_01723 [Synechococcus sp. PCC 7502]|uniref:hypothetical protein n=1 Tax=Synechococcus sp. PCC 7502 TaxID=1173263 RepID=UPI00029FAEB6|nr:hypothetical protein [Synechococcus sp. PCC 7502]AFY73775.1 hypothetical protein Syn7502_01723 [Synechococcus sp. PCC 7502]